jgi:hypothetical protein
MKLSVKGMALSLGLVWGGAMLIVGVGAIVSGPEGDYYGKDFLLAIASVYPGYKGIPVMGDVLFGAAYGFADGVIGGAVIAWLYNRFSGSSES